MSGVRADRSWGKPIGANGRHRAAIATIVAMCALVCASSAVASYSEAMSWLEKQQEAAQEFRVKFDVGYGFSHTGRVSGTVTDVDDLAGDRVGLPWVSLNSQHDDYDYRGPVAGQWGHLATPDNYRVEVFSVTDAPYLQGTFELSGDGTWDSGETVIHPGEKMVNLVRKSDDEVVAVKGGPREKVAGVAIRVFSRTDVDYLQEEVVLEPDGSWTTSVGVAPGDKIARLVRLGSGRTINSTEWANAEGYQGLVRSFWIPQDDLNYGYEGGGRAGYRLEQRSWIYDDALAALAFIQEGEPARAKRILEPLSSLQAADGSLPFSFDVFLGRVFEDYRRAGAIAWVGTAAVEYERATGDPRFRQFAERLADYLLSLQVTTGNGHSASDPRYGSVLGGRGSYDADYNYSDTPIAWASTEHNIDAYFFLRDLGYVTRDPRYASAADLVEQSLTTNHWNSTEDRFNQGVHLDGPDTAHALDLASWGGLFLRATNHDAMAEASLDYMQRFKVENKSISKSGDADSYNQTYSHPGPIDGYKPYDASPGGYENPPSVVWSEGTWGAILLKKRLGRDVSGETASMERMQSADPRGGFLYVSEGAARIPWEFHAWPSMAGTAWSAIVRGNDNILWRKDKRPEDEPPINGEDQTLDGADAARFRPSLYFDSGERWRPLNVHQYFEEVKIAGCDENPGGPTCHVLTSVSDFDASNDFLTDTHGDPDDSNTYRSPNPQCTEPINAHLLDCDSTTASAIYWDKRQPNGPYAYLTYWWYFRYNDAPGSIFTEPFYDHEGDWEGVIVAFPKGSAETFDYAALSSHTHWWRYLRETLSCDGGGGASCGSEERPLTKQRIDVAVANGTHANYPRPCDSTVVPLDPCFQTDAGGSAEVPEADFDAADPWGRNNEAGGLKRFPEQAWVDWDGIWGVTEDQGSPESPVVQSNQDFVNGVPSVECSERYTPDGDDCRRATRPARSASRPRGVAAPAASDEGTGAGSTPIEGVSPECAAWSGPFVAAAVCDDERLHNATRSGAMGKDGAITLEAPDRSYAVDSAPGISQAVGVPLGAGDTIEVSMSGASTEPVEIVVRTAGAEDDAALSTFAAVDLTDGAVIRVERTRGAAPAAELKLPGDPPVEPSTVADVAQSLTPSAGAGQR